MEKVSDFWLMCVAQKYLSISFLLPLRASGKFVVKKKVKIDDSFRAWKQLRNWAAWIKSSIPAARKLCSVHFRGLPCSS